MNNLNYKFVDKYNKAVKNAMRFSPNTRGRRKWVNSAWKYQMRAVKTVGMMIP